MSECKFRNIDTGQLVISGKGEENYFEKCPKCGTMLHSNRYKDLYVSNNEDVTGMYELSVSIDMLYCSKCAELYVSLDY